MSVALPQAGERSDEGAEVVVRLGVVAAFDSKLEEGEIRIDYLELGCLLPNRIESVLKNCHPITGLVSYYFLIHFSINNKDCRSPTELTKLQY